MTEVPEHLLRRSRERRDACSVLEPTVVARPPPAAADAPAADAPAAAPAAVPATTAAAAAPAEVAAAVAALPVDETPAYIKADEKRRTKNPIWVMPVLIGLPLWAYLYSFAFNPPKDEGPVDPMVLGGQVYRSAGCAGCHGASGEGGVGQALAGGESQLTFPDVADHVAWVRSGSVPFSGQKYGNPDRPGGQRVAKGLMPAFGSLSQEEIDAVVLYEREGL